MPVLQSPIQCAVTLARDFGATRLLLFGSALENPAQARDLDLACDGVPGWKLFELAARIEEETSIPLDLVPFLAADHPLHASHFGAGEDTAAECLRRRESAR
jgi:predicted nucleotidyltransferase